jgi:hypothetical protein
VAPRGLSKKSALELRQGRNQRSLKISRRGREGEGKVKIGGRKEKSKSAMLSRFREREAVEYMIYAQVCVHAVCPVSSIKVSLRYWLHLCNSV